AGGPAAGPPAAAVSRVPGRLLAGRQREARAQAPAPRAARPRGERDQPRAERRVPVPLLGYRGRRQGGGAGGDPRAGDQPVLARGAGLPPRGAPAPGADRARARAPAPGGGGAQRQRARAPVRAVPRAALVPPEHAPPRRRLRGAARPARPALLLADRRGPA